MLYPLFFAAVYLSHLTLLRLPYFWDEGGYYIPAAWDFFRTGSLIPLTTVTNAHPPLPSILLAAWWHLSGFVVSGTRTLVCLVAAAALLGVYRIARDAAGTPAAIATTLLTAIYPVWFAQSTLAHADIFAAAFTLWGLSFYLEAGGSERYGWAAAMFSLAALSKETSIVTPVALAGWELWGTARRGRGRLLPPTHDVGVVMNGAPTDGGTEDSRYRRRAWRWVAALLSPLLPLLAWYDYHYTKTGFVFGNPEFFRYNATANMDAHRVALGLYHRLLHLTAHMNMYVPVVCAVAALLMPVVAGRPWLSRRVRNAVSVVVVANWMAFSVLGGALLTRYLLPVYPLVLLVCVAVWQRHLRLRGWLGLGVLSAAAFLAGIWIDPPYAFAPEDNLTYRDMIVLHQQAVQVIEQRWPLATVLTAWPANAELGRPELGYTARPIKTVSLQNFSLQEMEKAAADPGAYDTALLFSTKWEPRTGSLNTASGNAQADARYFDFHHDLRPAEAAALLHGQIAWQRQIGGEWVAILRFPRIVNAGVDERRRRITEDMEF
jgi:4-amino-4-deoxy-L-arabinose transferase-like glycosyltransferase